MAKYNDRGEELPDDTPVEVPLRFRVPPPLAETIKQLIRGEMSRQAADSGEETFEEADDFDVYDEMDVLTSHHEMTEMQEEFRLEKQPDEVVDNPPKKEDTTPTPEVKADDKGVKDGKGS